MEILILGFTNFEYLDNSPTKMEDRTPLMIEAQVTPEVKVWAFLFSND
jgi:hypothetical protein